MRDLANATEISGTTETLGGYGLYDLVELEGSQVGCIVKVERDTVQVLMAGGTIERYVCTGNGRLNTVPLADGLLLIRPGQM